MKEKVVEILIYIMSEMQEDKRLSDIDLSDLRSRGYTQSEISAAFTWLYDTMQGNQGGLQRLQNASRGSRRMLHEAERSMMTPDAQGYLIQLTELGLLNPQDLETVIDRIMMAGYEKLSLAEVRQIAAAVLFSREAGDQGTGRSMLDSEDTIH